MGRRSSEKTIKHKLIYDKLCSDIVKGIYKPGERLPTENELAKTFNTSRPTIGRAMRDLQQKNLITRRQGQGTFVKQSTKHSNRTLGLLVHWQIRPVQTTSSTIFGIMVPELLKNASQFGYSLLLNDIPVGDDSDYVEAAETICKHLLSSSVAGVFFTPLELTKNNFLNKNIADRLKKAGIALVLLDRDLTDGYHRSEFDIVGINNEQSSLILTSHLIELGYRKIDFICGTVQTTAINDRYCGYRLALEGNQIQPEKSRLHQFDSRNLINKSDCPERTMMLDLVKSGATEAFVCVNDTTAADLINFFYSEGIKIPQDVRIVGFDDLPIDENLPVSLTTIRQNPSALAYEAVRTMLDRINHPDISARNIMLNTELIIRESCGSHLKITPDSAE
ncbi:MAG: GntR family transcriptional regulator [Planctomycetes bacterium]|nr:GntR family transcriptional regulator [Planctomycetota bacterium]